MFYVAYSFFLWNPTKVFMIIHSICVIWQAFVYNHSYVTYWTNTHVFLEFTRLLDLHAIKCWIHSYSMGIHWPQSLLVYQLSISNNFFGSDTCNYVNTDSSIFPDHEEYILQTFSKEAVIINAMVIYHRKWLPIK